MVSLLNLDCFIYFSLLEKAHSANTFPEYHLSMYDNGRSLRFFIIISLENFSNIQFVSRENFDFAYWSHSVHKLCDVLMIYTRHDSVFIAN